MGFRKLFHNLLPGVSLVKGCLSLKEIFHVPIRQRGANLYTTFFDDFGFSQSLY